MLLAIIAMLASTAAAQTTKPTMSVSVGFDGVFKPDNWAPVYVTLADADRRAGTLELRVAHARVGHDVVARVAANPDATTFTLYAPLGLLDAAQVQFRDATGAILARRDLGDAIASTPSAFAGLSVGVSGEPAAARRVANALTRDTGESVAAGAIDARLLPERAIGYRAIDVLVIAGLDTDALDDRVEQSILDWVRAGGILIAWPGTQRATMDSPLSVALPADVGDVAVQSIAGVDHVARKLSRRAGDVADLSRGDVATFRRRVGLGQIVLTAIDPTTLADASVDARLARWRTLTENECSLLPSDRRRGVFDPLVAQSVAEQSVRAMLASTPTDLRPWLWFALASGLLLGPGEIAMLVIARRHPRTPVTVVGLAIVVGAGAALCVVAQPRFGFSCATIEVIASDGPAATATVTAGVAPSAAAGTSSLGGDAADPTRQPTGLATIAQREESFETRDIWSGSVRPLTRSFAFAPQIASPATSGSTIARPHELVAPDGHVTPADDPATTRVETGIERLAADPQWSTIFLDRTLASRLVRLQESEGATIIATRFALTDGVRIALAVNR